MQRIHKKIYFENVNVVPLSVLQYLKRRKLNETRVWKHCKCKMSLLDASEVHWEVLRKMNQIKPRPCLLDNRFAIPNTTEIGWAGWLLLHCLRTCEPQLNDFVFETLYVAYGDNQPRTHAKRCPFLGSSTLKTDVKNIRKCVQQGWPNSRSRPLFFIIVYLNHNWRCKLGTHELSSAERNARYRRFFELLNNRPGLYQVILNLLSASYRKICGVMHQLHSRKVSEKKNLIVVNCFSDHKRNEDILTELQISQITEFIYQHRKNWKSMFTRWALTGSQKWF
jgi:uncharacterized radical SAM superfamily Fe-S cluster-containing enzyme